MTWLRSRAMPQRTKPTTATMRIATLTPSDAVAYRALMFEACEQAAEAFTSTADDHRAAPQTLLTSTGFKGKVHMSCWLRSESAAP